MSKLFFDTNMFIYLFEDYEPFSSMVDAVWRRMIQRGDKLVTSAMTLGELLVKPSKMGQASPIEQHDRAIRSRAQVVSFDPQVAWRYASLRATCQYWLKIPQSAGRKFPHFLLATVYSFSRLGENEAGW